MRRFGLKTLCRFFVVEDHILNATRGLVTRAFTDELWNMALSKIIAVLRTHSVSVSGEAGVCLFVIESCYQWEREAA